MDKWAVKAAKKSQAVKPVSRVDVPSVVLRGKEAKSICRGSQKHVIIAISKQDHAEG